MREVVGSAAGTRDHRRVRTPDVSDAEVDEMVNGHLVLVAVIVAGIDLDQGAGRIDPADPAG